MRLWCVQYPFIQAVDIEVLDLGKQPPAIGGAKSYSAANDEAIIEAPVLWGGDARVRAAVRIKVGTFVLYLPVEVRDLQVCMSWAYPWFSSLGKAYLFCPDLNSAANLLHAYPG